jgi:CubicO group peptidase (beta-lactamase class C family)
MKEVEVRFRENFPAGRDSGSGMCFFEGQKKLISLYGGYLDAECLRPWREDTLVGIGSGTKGVVVACALHAMQEAGADLDSIIADYWPEFAQGGKRAMTLGQLLSHRSGLCAANDSKLQMLDKEGIVRSIEKQHPLLPSNTGTAYSPHLFASIWPLVRLGPDWYLLQR